MGYSRIWTAARERSAMAHTHQHDEIREASRRSLLTAFALTALLMVAEIVGSFVTGSLSLLAHAGHMLTHVASFGLALFAIRSPRSSWRRRLKTATRTTTSITCCNARRFVATADGSPTELSADRPGSPAGGGIALMPVPTG